LGGITISSQGEEDGNIPIYIHLKYSRRINTSTMQAHLLFRVPQIKQSVTGKIRAIREGSLYFRDPRLFNSLPVNIPAKHP